MEPPVPSITATNLDTESDHVVGVKTTKGHLGRWRRTVGLLMLGVVIFLWTASSFLASAILADNTYSKPYFIVYLNTAFFVVPLIPVLVLKAHRHPEELRQWKTDSIAWMRGLSVPFKRKDSERESGTINFRSRRRRESTSESRQRLLDDETQSRRGMSTKNYQTNDDTFARLTLSETTQLSFEFCLLWFIANYFIGASLQYTTVASSTILTSTSSIFTLIFGVVAGVEIFTLRKLIAVLASLAGIILISSVDLSGNTADDDHRGSFPEKSLREIAVGDVLAFLAAVIYGIYAVFMKKRIADESVINMPLFFGLVGLMNVVLLWPGFLILHWTGIEPFELPLSGRTHLILVLNAVASLVADLAWAYAVVLTSPIIVTVGLSMTIPLSLLGQQVLNSQTANAIYWVGAIVVVLSFVFVNQEETKIGQKQQLEESGILADDRS